MTDYVLIPLTGKRGEGQYAKVSPEDYEQISRHTWRLHKRGYPTATITISRGVKKTLNMHRVLMPTRPGLEVDHVNRDKLDNRRSNLRLVTRRENIMNSDSRMAARLRREFPKTVRKGPDDGTRYVMYWCRTYKKWRGYVYFKDRKPIYAGSHLRKLSLWARCEAIAWQAAREEGSNRRI